MLPGDATFWRPTAAAKARHYERQSGRRHGFGRNKAGQKEHVLTQNFAISAGIVMLVFDWSIVNKRNERLQGKCRVRLISVSLNKRLLSSMSSGGIKCGYLGLRHNWRKVQPTPGIDSEGGSVKELNPIQVGAG